MRTANPLAYVLADGDQPLRLVARAPVEENVRHDIVGGGGGVARLVKDGSAFPEIEIGYVVFERLGDIGKLTEGTFSITFKNGRTLKGGFCGKPVLLTL